MSHFYYNTGLSKSQTKSAVRVADKRRFLGKCSFVVKNHFIQADNNYNCARNTYVTPNRKKNPALPGKKLSTINS
jgi:hypothetical protein